MTTPQGANQAHITRNHEGTILRYEINPLPAGRRSMLDDSKRCELALKRQALLRSERALLELYVAIDHMNIAAFARDVLMTRLSAIQEFLNAQHPGMPAVPVLVVQDGNDG